MILWLVALTPMVISRTSYIWLGPYMKNNKSDTIRETFAYLV